MESQEHASRREHRFRLFGIILLIVVVIGGCILIGVSVEPSRAVISQIIAQNCGNLQFPNDNATANQAIACMVTAYKNCHATTLVASYRNIDTLNTDTFVIEPALGLNRSCGLAVEWDNVVLSHDRSGTDICRGLDQRSDGLHFRGCGSQGDLLIPAD